MGTSEFNFGDKPAMDQHPIQWRAETLPAASYATETGIRPGTDGPP